MEEKLYFKPANYGKGKKKEQTKQKSEPKTEKNHKALKLVIVLLALVIIVAVIIWLLHGKTTTTGRFPENVRNESLECEQDGIIYGKTNKIKPESTKLKLTFVFYGEDNFASASLKYDATFTNDYEARKAEPIAHAQFAKELAADGFSFEEFNNKFSTIDNQLVLTLFINDGKIDDHAKSYFYIDTDENTTPPTKLSEYKTVYEKRGFVCKSSLEE